MENPYEKLSDGELAILAGGGRLDDGRNDRDVATGARGVLAEASERLAVMVTAHVGDACEYCQEQARRVLTIINGGS